MRETECVVKAASQFINDYKPAMKRGLRISLPEEVITLLSKGEELPEKYRDHALIGKLARSSGMSHSSGLVADLSD